MNKNHWANFKDPIAGWRAVFPPVQQIGPEPLIEFARRVLDAGERERVYRVLQAPDPFNYRAGSGKSYVEHMRETLEHTGGLYLFCGEGPLPTQWGQLRTPARVAYYDGNGSIQEEEIEDLGELLRRLRPEDVETNIAMRHVCPLVLEGRAWTRESPYEPKPVLVRLQLETDIWFPRVLGELEWPQDPSTGQGPDGLYDNLALAARHTPRLNRFIEAVREAALDLGGQWKLGAFEEPGLHTYYRHMCHETGIALDPPPATRA